MKRALRVLLLMAGALAAPSYTYAQGTTLTVTGLPLTFPQPTGSDIAAGFIESATPTTFVVETERTGANTQRTVIVSVRSLGNSGSATLQWRRADLTTWTTLTTANADVQQFTLRKGALETNDLVWRYLLNWSMPAGTTTYSIAVTLTVTVP